MADQTTWKNQSLQEFGNLFKLYTILTTSTGLDLPHDLSTKFKHEPENWQIYYETKSLALKETDHDVLISQGNKEYKEALKLLRERREEINHSMLVMVASKMLWLLDAYPSHAGSYHILACILFIANRLEEALEVLDMGRAINPDFEPFQDLEKEILSSMEGQSSGRDEVPVLINESLSPELLQVLLELFSKYDKDGDGCLNTKELDAYVFSTNGQHPPQSFIDQMGQRFGANEHGYLTKKGFLAFYLEQTLGDPSETRRDMRAHGYDKSTLKKYKPSSSS